MTKNDLNALETTICLFIESEYSTGSVTPKDALYNEGVNSLDKAELAMALDEKFDIFLPDDVDRSWKTVGDVIETVRKELEDAGN